MSGSGIVYSSQHGAHCPACDKPIASCVCRAQAGDGVVRVQRSTKGRRGKGVTIVTGIPLAADELAQLGKQLKKRCGTGGTVKDGVVEIQGDHRDLLVELLSAKGWTVKRAGG